MKTKTFKFLGYLETAGGPVCICPVNALADWTGASEESGLYWAATNEIGVELLEIFQDKFHFFNSETGNFILFRSEDELIVAEIMSLEPSWALQWQGINFDIEEASFPTACLNGLIAIFDAGLTLTSILEDEGILAVDNAQIWNTAFIKGDFTVAKQVSYKDEGVDIVGILFTK